MANIFATADNHFFHKSILKFCADKRGNCQTVEEMNEKMIEVWNDQISEKDTVYCLGDFSFGTTEETLEILKRLNGRIHLILGNHDYWITKPTNIQLKTACLNRMNGWIDNYRRIKIDKMHTVLSHYSFAEYDRMHYGAFHAYGHVHGSYVHPGRAIDVGIDARPNGDMRLWEWSEFRDECLKRPILSHHDRILPEEQYV